MEMIATALAISSIPGAVDAARTFLAKLAGPAVDELALLLQDEVKLYRLKNQLRILARAQEMLNSAGISPNAIPLRTLLPILECAALEDNESLSEKWAGLLANAAAKTDGAASHPSFPRILSELTPIEAQLLDLLAAVGGTAYWDIFKSDAAQQLHVLGDDVHRHNGNLFRLGLTLSIKDTDTLVGQLTIPPFGKAFLAACNPPLPTDAGSTPNPGT